MYNFGHSVSLHACILDLRRACKTLVLFVSMIITRKVHAYCNTRLGHYLYKVYLYSSTKTFTVFRIKNWRRRKCVSKQLVQQPFLNETLTAKTTKKMWTERRNGRRETYNKNNKINQHQISTPSLFVYFLCESKGGFKFTTKYLFKKLIK